MVFDGVTFDYAEELLSNPNNIELKIMRKQPIRSATGEKHPNTSNKLLSTNSISDSDPKVNTKNLSTRQELHNKKIVKSIIGE